MLNIGVFIICSFITLIIIVVGTIFTSGALLYLIYAANGALIEETTAKLGKRISENSSPFSCFIFILITLEFLFITSILFGIYIVLSRLIKGQPIIEITLQAPTTSPITLLTITSALLIIDSILLFKHAYLATIFHKLYAQNKGYYKDLIFSIIGYILCYSYLISFYIFLNDNLSGIPQNILLGFLPSIAGCLFFPYMIFTLWQSIYFQIKYRKQITSNFTVANSLSLIGFFIFNFIFIVFFYRTAQYLWFANTLT